VARQNECEIRAEAARRRLAFRRPSHYTPDMRPPPDRRPLSVPTVLAALVALAACGCAAPQPADLVFRGTVYTADPSRPSAQAVAVRDGVIVAVGDRDAVGRYEGPETRVIDLGTGMLLPGFHDSHVHAASGGVQLGECDLAGQATAEAIAAQVARCARENPEASWVRGRGWQLPAFPNANPGRALLDRLVPDRPALLIAADGHSAWANSAALALAGITAETPDPPDGRIERDPLTGEPSGTLRESAVDLVARLQPPYTPADWEAGARRGLALANSFGITAVHDANASEAILAAYAALDRRAELTARVTAAARVDMSADVETEVARLAALRAQFAGDRLRVTAAKLFADGVIEAGTAALLEPYLGTGQRGPARPAPELLGAFVGALDRAGFQVHTHAIGDRAVRLTLDAIAAARAANGPRDSRHQIAHLQLIDPADEPRFRALDVLANFQPLWAYRDSYIRDLTEPVLGPERSARLYPLGSMAHAGATLVTGSDWPVTSMNPLPAIQVAVTRREPDLPAGQAWLPNQLVALPAVLDAYTINAARAAFLEGDTGSIEVGKAADLVVLDRDLLAIPSAEIHSARVRFTFLDGREVYAAEAVNPGPEGAQP
jgi:predicted amidohydrolase YtcJ